MGSQAGDSPCPRVGGSSPSHRRGPSTAHLLLGRPEHAGDLLHRQCQGLLLLQVLLEVQEQLALQESRRTVRPGAREGGAALQNLGPYKALGCNSRFLVGDSVRGEDRGKKATADGVTATSSACWTLGEGCRPRTAS